MKEMNVEKYERDLFVCAACGYCKAACEIVNQQGWESLSPRGRIFLLKAIRKGEIKLKKDGKKKFSDNVFKCTLCSRCRPACPVDIDTRGLQIALRESLVEMGIYPEKLDLLVDSINQEHNVLNYPNDERASFLDFADDVPDDMYQREKAEVVYFIGCMAAFSPAVQSIPEAFIEVLKKAEIDFAILGENEWCCGFPLIVGGMKKKAEEIKKHNIEMIKKLGAKTVVLSCPSCYNTWIKEYNTDLEVMHSSQYIKKLIDEGKIKIKQTTGKTTYHDPCDLGRNSDVYKEPREVIKATGMELVEMAENKDQALCCGGGGDLEAIDAELANNIAKTLAYAVEDTGMDTVITACQQCKRMIMTALKNEGINIRVRDIVELINDNME